MIGRVTYSCGLVTNRKKAPALLKGRLSLIDRWRWICVIVNQTSVIIQTYLSRGILKSGHKQLLVQVSILSSRFVLMRRTTTTASLTGICHYVQSAMYETRFNADINLRVLIVSQISGLAGQHLGLLGAWLLVPSLFHTDTQFVSFLLWFSSIIGSAASHLCLPRLCSRTSSPCGSPLVS